MGDITALNTAAVKKLKEQYAEAGIEECEIKIPHKCWRNNALGFVHKHKRIWYRACPELLYAMSETLLGCTPCHQELEYNEKLTLQVFKRLRPKTMISSKSAQSEKVAKPSPQHRSKKPDWFRPHKCKGCGKVVTGTWHAECGNVTL